MKLGELRPEEEWARRLISAALSRDVVGNDFNSGFRTYDLRIGDFTRPQAAIEVVQAVSGKHQKAWKSGPGRGALHVPGLDGGWIVVITPEADNRVLRQDLGSFLKRLEKAGQAVVERGDVSVESEMKRLGIESAYSDLDGTPGTVYTTLPIAVSLVSEDGGPLVTWLSNFLQAVPDVLEKLATSAEERHVFIPVHFGGAPSEVLLYLTDSDNDGLPPLPRKAPVLPAPVTHVWVISVFAGHGLRWDGGQWLTFPDVERRP
ncbi:hypothetical protein ACFVGV_07070 [Pseudarthrobacter scleromae]|uniref:hypothetical protein n=1 Tax=Pseudarthrobacter scleromae TaxID=158897 RepID=UPI0036290E03